MAIVPPDNVPLIESVLVASTEIVPEFVSVPPRDSRLPLAVIVPMLTTIPRRAPPDHVSVPLFVNPPDPPVRVPPENWLPLPATEIAPLPPSDPLARIKSPAMVKDALAPTEPPQVLSMVRLAIEKEVLNDRRRVL